MPRDIRQPQLANNLVATVIPSAVFSFEKDFEACSFNRNHGGMLRARIAKRTST